jgi:hypothetical protein
MANRLVSVWLGQCAAAGNAHFQLAKVIEPRRYPARALTRFARRRGRTRLLPALAPHRVSRNRCEERVPLVLRNGHGTLLSIHGVRASHSHEKQALEPGKPARPSGSGVPAAQESFLGCPDSTNERTAHPESLGGMSGRAVPGDGPRPSGQRMRPRRQNITVPPREALVIFRERDFPVGIDYVERPGQLTGCQSPSHQTWMVMWWTPPRRHRCAKVAR